MQDGQWCCNEEAGEEKSEFPVLLVVGGVVFMILIGGAAFGFHQYRRSQIATGPLGSLPGALPPAAQQTTHGGSLGAANIVAPEQVVVGTIVGNIEGNSNLQPCASTCLCGSVIPDSAKFCQCCGKEQPK